jgi:hypothetical protein
MGKYKVWVLSILFLVILEGFFIAYVKQQKKLEACEMYIEEIQSDYLKEIREEIKAEFQEQYIREIIEVAKFKASIDANTWLMKTLKESGRLVDKGTKVAK